jgi:hypothetical protein
VISSPYPSIVPTAVIYQLRPVASNGTNGIVEYFYVSALGTGGN